MILSHFLFPVDYINWFIRIFHLYQVFLTYIDKNEFNLCEKRHNRCGLWNINLILSTTRTNIATFFICSIINKLIILNYQIKCANFDAVIWRTLWYLAVTHLLNYCDYFILLKIYLCRRKNHYFSITCL